MSHKQAKKLRKQLKYKENFTPATITHTKSWDSLHRVYIVISEVVVCSIRKIYQRTKRIH